MFGQSLRTSKFLIVSWGEKTNEEKEMRRKNILSNCSYLETNHLCYFFNKLISTIKKLAKVWTYYVDVLSKTTREMLVISTKTIWLAKETMSNLLKHLIMAPNSNFWYCWITVLFYLFFRWICWHGLRFWLAREA